VKILVAGLVNIETTVPVEDFPLPYRSTRFPDGIRTVVSGVGWNVASALHALGSDVALFAFCGDDAPGRIVAETVAASGVEATLLPSARTPQTVVLLEEGGRRSISSDLAGVAECRVPPGIFEGAIAGCDLAVLANVDWTRSLLRPTRALGIPIATDLHDMASLDNPYDTDYLETADVVFLSDERLPIPPAEAIDALGGRYGTEVIVVGLGESGALLGLGDRPPLHVPGLRLRAVRSTTGAGDALFAAFCHFRFSREWSPQRSLEAAVAFSSWKVGAVGGSEGFLDEAALERLIAERR
jgi:ribokinase